MAIPWATIGWRFAAGTFLAWISRQSQDDRPSGTQHTAQSTTVSETVGPAQIVLGEPRVGGRKAWASSSDYTRETIHNIGRWTKRTSGAVQLFAGRYEVKGNNVIEFHYIDLGAVNRRTELGGLNRYGARPDYWVVIIDGRRYRVLKVETNDGTEPSGTTNIYRVTFAGNLHSLPETISVDTVFTERGVRAEFVIAVSDGPCDGELAQIVIDGELHEVSEPVLAEGTKAGKMQWAQDFVGLKFGTYTDSYDRRNDPSRRSDLIQIFSFSKADGTEAQVESALYRYPETTINRESQQIDTGWTEKSKGYGISYVHIWIYQPAYSEEYQEANPRSRQYFNGEPEFEFIYKGREFWRPGLAQGTREWTDSAGAINYLVDTEYIEYPPEIINNQSVRESHDISVFEVTNDQIPDNWPAKYKVPTRRYTVNGIIRGDDSHERVRAELDFAWAGKRIVKKGIIHYRPGFNRDPVDTIDKNNSVPNAPQGMSPPLEIRINSATVTLAQSALDNYQPVILPEILDQPSIDNDGEIFHRDLGTRTFVNNPVSLARLATIWLRIARSARKFPRSVQPGDYGVRFDRSPTDRVILDIPDDRVGPDYPDQGKAVIDSRILEETGSIALEISERGDIYDDAAVVPPFLGPDALFSGRSLGPPTGLGAREESILQKDGFTFSSVLFFWNETFHPIVELWHRVKVPSETKILLFQGGGRQEIEGPYTSQWEAEQIRGKNSFSKSYPVGVIVEYRARSVERPGGLKSAFTPIQSIEVNGDDIAPADPSNVSYEALSGDFRLNYDIPPDRDYALTRIRGVNGINNSSSPPSDSPLIWAGRGGSGGIFTIPQSNNNAATGTIWIAHEDFSGNITDWFRLEVHQLAPDDKEEWIDIVWRLNDSDTTPPATPTDPYDVNYPRVPKAFNGDDQYLWGFARRRPRGIEGAQWSGFEPAVAWACGPTVEPSGRFTRQIRYQWRRRSVGGDFQGPFEGLPDGNQSTTLYPIVDIRVGYRGSTTSNWSAYGVWIPIEKLTARGGRVYGVEAEQSLSSPPLLPNLPTDIKGGVDSSNVPVATWTNPKTGLPDQWKVVWHFRFTTAGVNDVEIVEQIVEASETSARAVSVDRDSGTRITVSVNNFAGGVLEIYPLRDGIQLPGLAPVAMKRISSTIIPSGGTTEDPSNLAVSGTGATSGRATWKLPSGTVWDRSTKRRMRGNVRVVGSQSWGSELEFFGTATSASLTGLAANTNYEFRVAAWTIEGGYSNYLTGRFSTSSTDAHAAPRNAVLGDGIGSGGELRYESMSWLAPISGSPTGYEVRWRNVSPGGITSAVTSATSIADPVRSQDGRIVTFRIFVNDGGFAQVRAVYGINYSDWINGSQP